MNLLNCLLHEIEKSGGIAKMYEKATQELESFEKDDHIKLPLHSRETCKVMDIKTGKVFKNCSIAARSIKADIRMFQKGIKKNGSYKTFIKVA